MEGLSETEKKILNCLIRDSSKTFADIAKELDLSRQAVAYNVSALRKKGVIKRFTVDIDHGRLGIGLPVLVFVKMRHADIDRFKKIVSIPALKDKNEVEEVFTLSGEYALGVFGWWRNKEEYGLWKTELISQLEEAGGKGADLLYELVEFVIWDFYKHRGVFEVPPHIREYLKK